MTMVMAATMSHPGAMVLNQVRVYALDTLRRTPLLTDAFNTDSSSITNWRNSLLPPDEAAATLTIGELSHDSLGGRMRVDMDINPFTAGDDEPQLQGLSGRHYTQLQTGKDYHLQFRLSTDGAPEIDEVQLVLFSAGRIASGIPIPDSVITLSSGTLPDTLHTTFTALSAEMLVYINVMRNDTTPYHYYLDDFALREGWLSSLNCDPENLADEEEGWGYRYGFNGAERVDELYGDFNAYDLGARMYNSRLGKMFSPDPREGEYSWQSTYAYFKNSPILQIDFDGAGDYYDKSGKYLGSDQKWSDGMVYVESPNGVGSIQYNKRNYYPVLGGTIGIVNDKTRKVFTRIADAELTTVIIERQIKRANIAIRDYRNHVDNDQVKDDVRVPYIGIDISMPGGRGIKNFFRTNSINGALDFKFFISGVSKLAEFQEYAKYSDGKTYNKGRIKLNDNRALYLVKTTEGDMYMNVFTLGNYLWGKFGAQQGLSLEYLQNLAAAGKVYNKNKTPDPEHEQKAIELGYNDYIAELEAMMGN